METDDLLRHRIVDRLDITPIGKKTGLCRYAADNHFESGHSGEVGKDLVLNTVSKIGVSPTVTQCVKREYGNTSFWYSDCR
jgi:hypothetical protein